VKAVRATKAKLERELGERGAMQHMKRIRASLAAAEKQMNAELDRSFAIRGLNNVLASLARPESAIGAHGKRTKSSADRGGNASAASCQTTSSCIKVVVRNRSRFSMF
jgi:hypothetical protein